MADDELDLDVEKKAGKGKLIMIIAGVLLLIGIAVAVTLYFSGALTGGDSKDNEAKDAKPEIEVKKAIYMKLSPAFVVNFEDSSTVSYMQLEIQAMAREQDALDLINEHMPVIRNNILLLLSTQKYEEISTAAGKEKLRGEILASIQKVLDEETTAANPEAEKDADKSTQSAKVAEVYFTSFIMQ
jgi:flagellar FliL protein